MIGQKIWREIAQLRGVAAAPRKTGCVKIAVQISRHVLSCGVVAQALKSPIAEPVRPVADAEVADDELAAAVMSWRPDAVNSLRDEILDIGPAGGRGAFQPTAVTGTAKRLEPCRRAVRSCREPAPDGGGSVEDTPHRNLIDSREQEPVRDG